MKKLVAAALFAAMVASLASCGKSAKAVDTDYIYGKIDSVSGNDVVLLLADYNEEAESADAKDKSDKKSSDDDTEDSKSERKKPSRSGDGEGSRSFKMPEDGEMPEGFDPEKFSGEMPEGFDPESFGSEKSKGFSRSKGRESSGSSKYTLTGEQEELRIPVGTTVTTSLGVKTDFDALSAGDIIKCSVEKDSDGNDVVTEVWIMEQ